MSENKLTDARLKTYLGKPRDKQATIADGLGLSARISKKGGISWLFRFRLKGETNANWISLGRYPDVTLRQARVERDKCRELVANGIDPRVERKIQAIPDVSITATVRDALEFWLNEYANKRRSNAAKHKSQFEKWIYGGIGNIPVSGAGRAAWVDCLKDRAHKYPVAAGYVLQNAQQALRFCQKNGYAVDSGIFELDIDAIGGERQKKKSRTLIEEDSWKEFLDLIAWLNEGRIKPYYRNLIILLVVFGARTQEVRLSNVSEWNLDTMVWTVPPEHNKVSQREIARGYSGEIKRPIPEAMVPMITHLKQRTSNELLLGELKDSAAVSVYGGGIWRKLEHEKKWSLHDIRRTLGTGMGDLEIDPYIIEAILGHSLGGVQGIYNRSHFLSKKKIALDVWVGKLIELGLNMNPLFSEA
ncbi:tyrosine-type recombinase/integrase [Vibrio parahaemolyticus]|uniref:tyrosine-type recombinase/integrase n=1 Tax=Vibrio parahaemolyticus TaxID=670 RepID=UPI0036F39146